jgi:hypothetical protein
MDDTIIGVDETNAELYQKVHEWIDKITDESAASIWKRVAVIIMSPVPQVDLLDAMEYFVVTSLSHVDHPVYVAYCLARSRAYGPHTRDIGHVTSSKGKSRMHTTIYHISMLSLRSHACLLHVNGGLYCTCNLMTPYCLRPITDPILDDPPAVIQSECDVTVNNSMLSVCLT